MALWTVGDTKATLGVLAGIGVLLAIILTAEYWGSRRPIELFAVDRLEVSHLTGDTIAILINYREEEPGRVVLDVPLTDLTETVTEGMILFNLVGAPWREAREFQPEKWNARHLADALGDRWQPLYHPKGRDP